MSNSVEVVTSYPGYLRVAEGAEHLKVSGTTVRGWLRKGRLWGTKTHSVWLISDRDFAVFRRHYDKSVTANPWGLLENTMLEIFPEGLGFL